MRKIASGFVFLSFFLSPMAAIAQTSEEAFIYLVLGIRHGDSTAIEGEWKNLSRNTFVAEQKIGNELWRSEVSAETTNCMLSIKRKRTSLSHDGKATQVGNSKVVINLRNIYFDIQQGKSLMFGIPTLSFVGSGSTDRNAVCITDDEAKVKCGDASTMRDVPSNFIAIIGYYAHRIEKKKELEKAVKVFRNNGCKLGR
jgi:hypothetical protein